MKQTHLPHLNGLDNADIKVVFCIITGWMEDLLFDAPDEKIHCWKVKLLSFSSSKGFEINLLIIQMRTSEWKQLLQHIFQLELNFPSNKQPFHPERNKVYQNAKQEMQSETKTSWKSTDKNWKIEKLWVWNLNNLKSLSQTFLCFELLKVCRHCQDLLFDE